MLLKFHGIYQQDDRDVRRSRTQQKLPLDYSCMVRTSVPGGVITLDQWLALDRLAELADGAMRLTTRQGVQYHFVPKGELHDLVARHQRLVAHHARRVRRRRPQRDGLPVAARRPAGRARTRRRRAGRRFRPRTPSYWELWVDGERAVTAEAPPADGPVEPLYGETYLPRKFKIGIAWPGDNCVDIYSNDVGIVPTLSEGLTGELTGFVVLAGGGMGMSHSRPDDTYPVLGRPVAWVPPADLGDVVEAIVTTQRDFGNRDDRHRARLKYTLEEHGIDWLRTEIEARTGRTGRRAGRAAAHGPSTPITAGTHRRRRHARAPGAVGQVSSATIRDAAPRRRAVGSRLRDPGHAAPGPAAVRRHRPRRAVERAPRANDVALAGRGEPAAAAGDRLPGAADVRQGAGRGRARPAGGDRRAREAARRHRQRGPGDPAQHDRVPERLRPAVLAPRSASSGARRRTTTSTSAARPGGDRLAQRVRADIPLDELTAHLRPLLERFADDADRRGVDAAFGDWCHAQGVTTLETWLPAPTVRRRGRSARDARARSTS